MARLTLRLEFDDIEREYGYKNVLSVQQVDADTTHNDLQELYKDFLRSLTYVLPGEN